jgi:hypothetical protein
MFNDLWTLTEPHIVETCVAVILAIFGYLATLLRQKWGIDITLANREILDQALHRILQGAFDRNLSKDAIIDIALSYLRATIPGTLRKLGATDATLRDRIATEIATRLGPASR